MSEMKERVEGRSVREKIMEMLLQGLSPELTSDEKWKNDELIKCKESVVYFVTNYCFIYDTTDKQGQWIRFELWNEQREVLGMMVEEKQVVILKARQNGMTWLALGYALWEMLFRPIAFVPLYSLRDDEAIAMLGDKLEGMYSRLPDWMRLEFVSKSKHRWRLSNGSTVLALPATAGDSYTATAAIIDEADLLPDLNTTLQRIQPTIDAGGKLFLLSRSNKKLPNSLFKNIYRNAKKKENNFKPIFLSWKIRPSRTQEWYELQKQDSLANTGSLDNLYESYPSTDVEALAPSTLDKRIPFDWLNAVYDEAKPLDLKKINFGKLYSALNGLKGLRIFRLPEGNKFYRLGGDPAEGNPTSDDSVWQVVDSASGEQCAVMQGKFEPGVFTNYGLLLSLFYNSAPALIERNNHGHSVILEGRRLRLRMLNGDDGKAGYLENARTKVKLYDDTVEIVKTRDCRLYDFETFTQLSLIEGSSLKAPAGENDDLAVAMCLAQVARKIKFMPSSLGALSMARVQGWKKASQRR